MQESHFALIKNFVKIVKNSLSQDCFFIFSLANIAEVVLLFPQAMSVDNLFVNV